MSHYVACLLLGMTIWISGCNSLGMEAQKIALQAPAASSVVLQPKGSNVELAVGCMKGLEESKIDGAKNLQQAQFLDSNTGWVASAASLFRTNDSGTTWQRSKVEMARDSWISSFFFTTPQTGWLAVVSKIDVAQFGLGYSSRLLVTNNGGNTWTERQSFPDEVELKLVRFRDGRTGFAAGSRMVKRESLRPEIFLSRTQDGGSTWVDLSARINNAVTHKLSVATGAVQDLIFTTPSRINILTDGGSVVLSTDLGESWREIAHFTDERPQSAYQKLVLDGERTTVLSGTISQEGVWGDISLKETSPTWSTYEINNLAVFDAQFLSSSEIILCGGAFAGPGERSGSHYDGRRLPGVILRSFDGGQSWLEIYRRKTNQPIIELIKVGPHKLYAVGNDGAFLRFELQTCSGASTVARAHKR